jgi:hypothetical protein
MAQWSLNDDLDSGRVRARDQVGTYMIGIIDAMLYGLHCVRRGALPFANYSRQELGFRGSLPSGS